jgi:hypothetical protein
MIAILRPIAPSSSELSLLDNAAISRIVDELEEGGVLLGGLVWLGIALEICADVVAKWTGQFPNLSVGLHISADILIFGGVWGEWTAHRKGMLASKTLTARQETELSRIRLEIVEASEKLEAEKIKRLQLERWLAPRRLTESQILALYDFARSSSEHDLDVVIVGSLSDTREYACEIASALQYARWNVVYWQADPKLVQREIYVEFFGGTDPATAAAARGLLAVLKSEGIDCKDEVGFFTELISPKYLYDPPTKNQRIAHIRMYVGQKKDFDPTFDAEK